MIGVGGAATRVMGVLNVTPDSFSDGGRFDSVEAAIVRGRELSAQGAGIVDVGGESTRPGATPVEPGEERRRVLPVVRALTESGIEVSVDTLHAETAVAAVEAGARYVNDVSGGTFDPGMREAVAGARIAGGPDRPAFVIGHWRGIPDPAHQRSDYADVVAEVRDALRSQAEAAAAAGVDPGRIVLDPGLGFDKTGAQCWRLLRELDVLTGLGYRVLVGASRKRMLAETLRALPEAARANAGDDYRDLGTAVVSALSARAGAWGVRVHDVPATVQALAVQRAWDDPTPSASGRSAEEHAGAAQAAPEPAPRRAAPDTITLTGLEVFAHHGVFDFERERGQRFVVDAEVSVDMRRAAHGDDLAATVHYGELAEALVAAVEREPVDLIETVAERAAGVALGFSGVRSARITVHKPDAPIDAVFRDVAVTVERRAGGEAS